jgi:hypothetical protein
VLLLSSTERSTCKVLGGLARSICDVHSMKLLQSDDHVLAKTVRYENTLVEIILL